MQRAPRIDNLRRIKGVRWSSGIVAVALAVVTALGQSAPKASAVARIDAKPPSVELGQRAEVLQSSARLIQEDEAEILDLAAQMRTEVDHNPHDFLLMDVVRKAEQIRRLAGRLKREMKLTSRRK